jgi:hypothetical protein
MYDAPSPDTRRLIFRLADVFEGRVARVALALMVIVSLLPLGSLDLALRPVFLLAFGAELLVRFLVWRADVHGTRVVTVPGVGFAVVDVVAFLSFLPLELWLDDRELLALLALVRLTRLAVLLRFARGLGRDLYAIVTRREQLQTLTFVSGAVVVLSLVAAIVLSQLAVRIEEDPNAPQLFSEKLWWAFRQLESADNLVPTLQTDPILVVISLGLTLTGVFLIAFVIGVGSNVVDQLVKAERRRDLAYAGHTVVIGAVHEGEELIREFVRIYAKNRQVPAPERLLTWLRYMRPHGARTFPRVALLARDEEMPNFLVEPIMRWVVYRQGDESDPDSLRRVAAKEAKRAIFLAQRRLGLETDAVTISALAALRAENRQCHAYVEVDDPEAKDIVLQVGGKNTVALDVPRFLGMFLCQHLLMPGIEGLYRDLLTSDGAEIYTHIFTDSGDQEALSRLPEFMPFSWLVSAAARRGVVVIGLYMGADHATKNARGVVEMDDLVRWLNPADDVTNDGLVALGAKRGLIPTRALRGLIGIAESYLPLRHLAADVVGTSPSTMTAATSTTATADADASVHVAKAIGAPPLGPKRVALIGTSDSLPSLLRELSLFVPGVDVVAFMSSRSGEKAALARRLEALKAGFVSGDTLPGERGRQLSLPKGGTLTVFTHDAPDLARFAADRLQSLPPVEAAVFLCEADGTDKDARTAMRVLRFIRLLESGTIPRGDKLHLVAEFISIDKGHYLQHHVDVRKCGFSSADDLRLTLIAKETIKSYFMVHASFVPGVADIYDELLEERGQDIVRFTWTSAPGTTVAFSAIAAELRGRGAVAIAVERKSDRSVVIGTDDVVFDGGDIAGIYAVGEGKHDAA